MIIRTGQGETRRTRGSKGECHEMIAMIERVGYR